MKKAFYLSLTACMLITFAQAQTPRGKKFEVYQGKPGITRKFSDLHDPEAAKALKEKPKRPLTSPFEFRLQEFKRFKESLKIQNPGHDEIEKEGTADSNGALAAPVNSSTQNIWSNFLASTFEEYPFVTPPDPNGAVGTNQVVTVTNGLIKFFEKRAVTDAPLVSYKAILHTPAPSQFAIPLDQFFSPLLTDSTYTSDPHIRFDRLTKRWFITAIEINPSLENNNIFIAVSDGDHITDETNFIFYHFPSDLLPHSSKAAPPLLDYPRLGVDKNAVLIGGRAFFLHKFECFTGVDSNYSVGYAIDKKALLHGQLRLYALQLGVLNYINGTGYGMYVPQGVYNSDPAAPKSFFAGISLNLDGIVLANLVYNSNGNLEEVTESVVPVTPFQFPRDVTALGSPMIIDPLDTRLLEVSIYKNKKTGKSALWTAHAIGVNQAGDFASGDNFVQEARTAARWYEIGNIYTKPGVTQSGTLYDAQQASGRRATHYFNPSIAANGQGTAVLGGSTSAYNKYLNAFVAGRFYSDDKNTQGAPQLVTATSAGYALVYGNYFDRWGDYSQTVVDPQDDQTIWSFQEYANADDSYGLRAIQVKAPPPATPLQLDAISNKDNLWITVKGVSVDHSGFFDPGKDEGGPGYNRLSVKVSGGLIASNIRFDSPTQIRFWLNARNKPAGTYTVIITNPDGQAVTTELKIVAETLKTVPTTVLQDKEVQEYTTGSSVTPNPTPDHFTLQIQAAKDWKARVVLMDLSGKQLSVNTYSLGKGSNQFALSLTGYDKGTYLAAVYNQNNALIALQKIIKQ